MSFSFCLNKNELLFLAGFGLLFQGLDLNRKGKLIQDSQRHLCSVIKILERNDVSGSVDLKKIACATMSIDREPKAAQGPKAVPIARRKSDIGMGAPKTATKSARKQPQAQASSVSSSTRTVKQTVKQENKTNRQLKDCDPGAANPANYDPTESSNSVSSDVSAQHGCSSAVSNITSPRQIAPRNQPNIDMLSIHQDLMPYSNVTPITVGSQFKDFGPERLAGYLATQQTQGPYENLFHSPPEIVSTYISPSPSSVTYDWSSDLWAMPSDLNAHPASAQSVLSFSEEEVTSAEDLSSCDPGGEYRGILIPNVDRYPGLEFFESFGHQT